MVIEINNCPHNTWRGVIDGYGYFSDDGPIREATVTSCVDCGHRLRWSEDGGWCMDIWTKEEIELAKKEAAKFAEILGIND